MPLLCLFFYFLFETGKCQSYLVVIVARLFFDCEKKSCSNEYVRFDRAYSHVQFEKKCICTL